MRWPWRRWRRSNDRLAAELGLTADAPTVRRLQPGGCQVPYVCTAPGCVALATHIVARGGLWRFEAACDDPHHLAHAIVQDLTEPLPLGIRPNRLKDMEDQLEPDGQ